MPYSEPTVLEILIEFRAKFRPIASVRLNVKNSALTEVSLFPSIHFELVT
jgi:hypothetical protein